MQDKIGVKNAKNLQYSSSIKTTAIFCFFAVETWFFVCTPIFGSCLGVQKEMGKKLFFLEIIGGHICPPPRKISWI